MIHWLDVGNSIFEWLGCVAAWRSVHAIHRDKKWSGTRIEVALFFTTWGIWNLLFYSALRQWVSFLAGVILTLANIAWLWLMFKYRQKKS